MSPQQLSVEVFQLLQRTCSRLALPMLTGWLWSRSDTLQPVPSEQASDIDHNKSYNPAQDSEDSLLFASNRSVPAPVARGIECIIVICCICDDASGGTDGGISTLHERVILRDGGSNSSSSSSHRATGCARPPMDDDFMEHRGAPASASVNACEEVSVLPCHSYFITCTCTCRWKRTQAHIFLPTPSGHGHTPSSQGRGRQPSRAGRWTLPERCNQPRRSC